MVVFSAGMMASPALAKKCKTLCREDIAACRLATCKALPNHRKKCNRTCKQEIIALCKQHSESTTCSPSGAFLDPAAF
jgi:hypothetical protein